MGPAGSGTATRNAARTRSEERFAQCATNRQPMLCAISTGGAERRAMAASSPRSHSAQTGRSQSRCCTRCQPGCRSSHKVCQWPGPELPMPGTIRATTPSLVVLCLSTPCTLREPGDRTNTGCAPAGETGREQIPARRRLPIHHFSCAEHSRQRFKHQPLVERLTGHTACRADRLLQRARRRQVSGKALIAAARRVGSAKSSLGTISRSSPAFTPSIWARRCKCVAIVFFRAAERDP